MTDEPKINPVLENKRPRPTGSLIVAMRDGVSPAEAIRSLETQTQSGVRATSLGGGGAWDTVHEVTYLEDLNAAFIPSAVRERNNSMLQILSADDRIVEVRPEFYLFKQQEFVDTSDATWGVAATRALESPYTGKGIKLCILDTGIDHSHPDFADRHIVDQSFIEGESIDDLQGHGTHCAGTAVGFSKRAGVLRYGIAPDADLYIGKVLNNRGFGAENDILRGIQWAIDNRCEVISMSLGSTVREGEKPSILYERIGQKALDSGCLIVAAAGNDSNRTFGFIAPVGSPANASTILAVGAIDPKFQMAYFSNGGLNANGGEIDLVAPGVGIFSASPNPQLHRTMSGTSMACPHVAGVAALWAESDPKLRGKELWRALRQNARLLTHPPRDAGSGLATAPLQAAIANLV